MVVPLVAMEKTRLEINVFKCTNTESVAECSEALQYRREKRFLRREDTLFHLFVLCQRRYYADLPSHGL